jgi:sugar lactone lactonase YvrE
MSLTRPAIAALLFACLAGYVTKAGGAKPAQPSQKHQVPDFVKTSHPSLANVTSDKLQAVATFTGPMPTGVAVTNTGRVFVNFPRWGDKVEFTVAEVKDGQAVPYPDLAMNQGSVTDFKDKFVSVQSVVVDAQDRLWVLDTGNINFGQTQPHAGKLICFDLNTNQIIQTIPFPGDVALPTTYLNDVRFDLARGPKGFAFISDSSAAGPNAVIVVDLSTGKSWRRLHQHPSVEETPNFMPTVEGQTLAKRDSPGAKPQPLKIGCDGIAISADGKTLYYTALAGHHLYAVSTDALADPNVKDDAVAATVKDLGDRGFASDGLESDAQGRVYLTDYENNAIRVRDQSGKYTILVQDARLIWPDTLALAPNGWLYVTANQLNRQPTYQEGQDKREKPYVLFRIKTDGTKIGMATAK